MISPPSPLSIDAVVFVLQVGDIRGPIRVPGCENRVVRAPASVVKISLNISRLSAQASGQDCPMMSSDI
jgi:hypothetical protein